MDSESLEKQVVALRQSIEMLNATIHKLLVMYKANNKCSKCNGRGRVPFGGFSDQECSKCEGTGVA